MSKYNPNIECIFLKHCNNIRIIYTYIISPGYPILRKLTTVMSQNVKKKKKICKLTYFTR